MRYLFPLFFCVFSSPIFAQINFDEYFLPKTLRLDYIRAGNVDTSFICFEELKEEPYWGGSKKNLIDNLNMGVYMVQVFDKASSKLIYTRGYSTLFYEWAETDEAKLLSRSFYESVVMPFPKNSVVVKILNRDWNQKFQPVFSYDIDPLGYVIHKEKNSAYGTEKIFDSGDPSVMLDIVVLPEGYKSSEMLKFKKDVQRFIGYFFKVSPFAENKDKFNFWTVNAPSVESGTDIPGKGIWKNTVLNSQFYTFDVERYLTTRDVKKIRDLASNVPYDQIYILVNSEAYGGGGVFNYYNLCTSDNQYSEEVFTHEFGHAFAGLGDEYDGSGKVGDLYNTSVEPWQSNLTNLVDFESKWKSLTDKDIPIPTPDIDFYKNKVGAFEGAAYVKKGMYRPVHDCKMRSNATKTFCPVCLKAINDLIKFYTE